MLNNSKLKVSIKAILVLVLLQINTSFSQNFKYKSIPKNYYVSIKDDNSSLLETTELRKIGYKLINSLPLDFDKTGKKDYTDIIQKTINNNRIVIFPDFPLLINPKGLTLTSESKIVFSKKSKLLLMDNDKELYEVLRIHNVKNISLYFPNIVGDRKSHKGLKGEWGMGISIRGSENIKIFSPVIRNCWGDGIYIGTGKQINRNILIKNALLDNNRRNGISVISVIGLDIINPLIANTNGARPMAGIDFEPNNNLEDLKQISVLNPITYNNSIRGILFALNNFYGTNEKNMDILIKNHIDDGSAYAMGFSLTKLKNESSSKKLGANKVVNGSIKINNPIWKNNIKEPIQFYELFDNNIQIDLTDPKVYQGSKIDQSKTSNLKNNVKTKFFNRK